VHLNWERMGWWLGLLDLDAASNVARTRALVELAAPLPVTFHRAIDMTPDLKAALEDVIENWRRNASSRRVGHRAPLKRSMWFLDWLKWRVRALALCRAAASKRKNITAIAQATGAHEFHTSARSAFPSPVRFRKQGMALAMRWIANTAGLWCCRRPSERLLQRLKQPVSR